MIWGSRKEKLESADPVTDRHGVDHPVEPSGATEPIMGSYEVSTYDYNIFEQVDGNWQLQPQGLQVEIGNQVQDSFATAANSYQVMQQKEEPEEGNEETMTAEDICWIHGILATTTTDLRREGELETAFLEWDGGTKTTIFHTPKKENIAAARKDRWSSPKDRAGWALTHWYEQGMANLPVWPACSWCGQPTDHYSSKGFSDHGRNGPHIVRCLECTRDEELMRGMSAHTQETDRDSSC